MPHGIRFSARLVLDLREWYAMHFGGAFQGQVSLGGVDTAVRAVVRPSGPVTVIARPVTDPTPGMNSPWPFGGEMQLVTTRTPSGLLAFYGRVRSSPEAPARRILLERTECDLKITATGYLPLQVKKVRIPSSIEIPQRVNVELIPGPNYPFSAADTLLRGSVWRPNGSGTPGVTVTVVDAAGNPVEKLKSAETDEIGQWVLLLRQEGAAGPLASPVRLKFTDPDGTPLATHGVQFVPRRTNLMPQTLLRGYILRADGEVVGGAKITVGGLPGETESGPGGGWSYAFGVGQPLTGNVSVDIQVEVEGHAPVVISVNVSRGETNSIPPITV